MVKFLIHRPIAVLMTTLGILILGLYASGFIPVSLMPDIDIPEITIQVTDENMSARQLEDGVIRNLRNQLKQVSHLKDIKSETTNGLGVIRLRFTHDTKIDFSFIEVNEKIDRLMGSLPKTMKRPKVIKASATDIPIFYIGMTLKDSKKQAASHNKELYPISQEFVDFSRFTNQVIKKRIEQVPEVAMVDVSGLVTPEILVIPNLEKLQSLGLNLNELESAIKKGDVRLGNLSIKDNQYEYNIRLGSKISSIKDVEDLHIKKHNRIFQLKELAQVIEHPRKRKGLVLSEGKEAVTMAVIKQHDARMGDLKEKLNTLLKYLRKDYENIDFKITRSQTKLLDYAIGNLTQSLLWGITLAFLIMFLFLKNLKSPILIAIVIPISLVVCVLFFQLFKISINIISLSGLILGIGLMIDNSIIVIDNITQYRTQGCSVSKACVLGTNEVFKPLLSSALTTCAVFLPLVFISGTTGALFYDQAMAITTGLFVSLTVSLTVLPVLYYAFHKKGELNKKGKISHFLEKMNPLNYESFYEKGFHWVMRRQKTSWGIAIIILLLSIILYQVLPKTQMPNFTKTETLLKIDWNEQINVDENKERILKILETVKEDLMGHTALVGSQQFILDKEALARTSETTLYLSCETPKILRKIIKKINVYLKNKYPSVLFQYKEVDNIFSLIFSDDKTPLVARMRNIGRLKNQQNEQLKELWYQVNQNIGKIELNPIVWQESIILAANKEKLMVYEVNESQLFNKLKSGFREKVIFSITDNQDFVPVVLGGEIKSIQEVLNETVIESRDSAQIYVKEFINIIHNKDLKTIVGGVEGEYYPLNLQVTNDDIEDVIQKVEDVVKENKWYEVNFSGSIFENREMINELIVVLLISLILLYFILASQFESFLLPLIILFEIPIDLAGAFLFLKLFGMSINLMSLIGIVVMSGIIINDSILKIDTIIQLQNKGYSLLRALLIAGQRRLKPILMTSLTTVLALIPLLFSSGLGAELQAPLAVSLIGGMLLGTVVSLYFIPLCYYYMAKATIRK